MLGKPRTKAQARRIQIITQELGCLACWKEGHEYEPAQCHHCDDQKQDHDRTYALCLWHHQGHSHDRDWMELTRGPSKALESKQFTARYGTEQELLDLQNQRLEEWEKNCVSSVNYVTEES